MDQTLDLDISWNSSEILSASPGVSLKNDTFIEKLMQTEEMLQNLKINFSKCNERNKILYKTNSEISKENHRLRQKICKLENELNSKAKSDLPTLERKSTQQFILAKDPNISSSIISADSLTESNAMKVTCCCTKDGNMDKSQSHKSSSFYKFRDGGSVFKRPRPQSWFVECPKKRFLDQVVISQLPLFRF